jgi:hypothetical protein
LNNQLKGAKAIPAAAVNGDSNGSTAISLND